MKLNRPDLQTVYVKLSPKDSASSGEHLTLYDTTPAEVADMLRRIASGDAKLVPAATAKST